MLSLHPRLILRTSLASPSIILGKYLHRSGVEELPKPYIGQFSKSGRMTEVEDEGFKAVDLSPESESSAQVNYPPQSQDEEEGQPTHTALHAGPPTEELHPTVPTEELHPTVPTEEDPAPPTDTDSKQNRWMSALDQFKLKRFLVLRPGTLQQAIEDIRAAADKEVDGGVQSFWLMAEVDHWNNEKERVVVITDHTLLICKYDFMMLQCEQIQRVPLNFVDRVSHGEFSFPERSLLAREGEGLRIFWDRMREPSFTSRWNPFTTDYPFISFTYHPVRNINENFTTLCDIQNFREQLKEAAQKAHALKPVPGKANGILVLNQPIHIEAYVGLMSFIGNQNKLGYSLARGNIGF